MEITIMYCRQCGASNPEGTKFCQECRRRVEGYRDPVFYAESAFWNHIGNLILIVGLSTAAITLVLALFIFVL
ncbi:MAG: zinc ribbon domain-containing protein [Thermoplasmata archaeon]|nr:zinc ribbon domain-containing protein [Thermoplasmata archaeon]